MKLLSWNCQGLASPLIVRALKNWCWRDRPGFVFLMETMIEDRKLELVRAQCGYDAGLCFSSVGEFWRSWLVVET